MKNEFKKLVTQEKYDYPIEIPINNTSQQKQKVYFKLLTRKPIVPSEDEIRNNKRSHSAKLRLLKKI